MKQRHYQKPWRKIGWKTKNNQMEEFLIDIGAADKDYLSKA